MKLELRKQFRAWRSGGREQLLKKALLESYKPKNLNYELMCLVARELDVSRRDTRYRPPFSVARKNKVGHEEEEGDDVQAFSP